MKVLEIIQLRSTGGTLEALSEQINESLDQAEGRTEIVKIFRQEGLQTDLAIHIHHPDASGATEPSKLGLCIAAALKEYGLVKHTIWKELK